MNTILYVDDEPTAHKLLGKYFESYTQYKIEHAFSGQEALKIFTQKKIDLIILDAIMPDLDGFETAVKIREIEEEFTPIIMLTALSDKQSRKNANKININDFLTKPVDYFALELSLHNLLELKKMFKEVHFFKNFYLSVIESLSDSVLVIGANNQILFSNFMAKKMIQKFGLSEKDFFKHLLFRISKSKNFIKKVLFSFSLDAKPFEELLVIQNFYFQVKVIPNLLQNQIVMVFRDLSDFYKKTSQLESDLKKRERDIRKAIYIQKNLLEKPLPKHQSLVVRSFYVPSSSIGGDFHAVFKEKNKIAGIIADVSGHGIEAALYNTLFFMAVENHKEDLFQNTGQFLTILEKEMSSINLESNFITAFAFCYHLNTQKFYFASAGHHMPFLTINNEIQDEKIFNKAGGPPLCVGLSGKYEENQISLKGQDFRMVIYTDGFVENFHEQASYQEEINALAQSLLLNQNLEKELKKVQTFFLNQKEHPDLDDISLIVLQKKAPFSSEIKINSLKDFETFQEKLKKQLIIFDYLAFESTKMKENLSCVVKAMLPIFSSLKISVRLNASWAIFRVEALSLAKKKFLLKDFIQKQQNLCSPYSFFYNENPPALVFSFKKKERLVEYSSRIQLETKGEE